MLFAVILSTVFSQSLTILQLHLAKYIIIINTGWIFLLRVFFMKRDFGSLLVYDKRLVYLIMKIL